MLYVILGLLLIAVIWFIAIYNGFVKMKIKLNEAYSTMDVYLKKRYDLIPNIVETVKGYAGHESETLEKVTAARSAAMASSSVEKTIEAENAFQSTLKSLFALSESYPELKANVNFLDLQSQLQRIEEDIANSRKYYNAITRVYSTKIAIFPNMIVANMFKFTKMPMFEVTDGVERENVKVEF